MRSGFNSFENCNLEEGYPSFDHLKTSAVYDLTRFPIYIDDSDPNHNWSKTAETYDWLEPAAGTLGDPYIIQNILIDNLGSNNNSITIRHSTSHFIIRNCYLYNTSLWGYEYESNGIYLYNVNNGRINNNQIYACKTGIRLDYSYNNGISSNFIYQNDDEGIIFSYCDHNLVYNNTISSNSVGFRMESADNNVIDKNLILGTSIGISLSYAWENNITNNELSQNSNAIYLYRSEENLFSKNSIFKNGLGIELDYYSDFNDIMNNLIYNNSNGIYSESGEHTEILHNEIYENKGFGIHLENVDRFSCINNSLWSNSQEDIYLKNTGDFYLSNNTMDGSGVFIETSYSKLIGVNIDTTNTVNGKPIYFYFNQTHLNSDNFSNAGQIYCFYSSDIDILNSNFEDVSTGITLNHCNDIEINNVEVLRTKRWGIRLYCCVDNSLSLVSVINNTYGLTLDHCFNNHLTDNLASYNLGPGFNLNNCTNNNISENTATYNRGSGLSISGVNNTYVFNNMMDYNGAHGMALTHFGYDQWIYVEGEYIRIWSCINNLTVLSNLCRNNNDTGLLIDSVNGSMIMHNTFNDNFRGIQIIDAQECEIYENTANNNGEYGFKLEGGLDLSFYNNTANNNYYLDQYGWVEDGWGYIFTYCDSVDINNNQAIENLVGMLIKFSYDCKVEQNEFTRNGDEYLEAIAYIGSTETNLGLSLENCNFLDVLENELDHNSLKLIESHNNSLILNDIVWGGFILQYCNQNVILGNSIYRGRLGVDLQDSSYNHILNNTIVSEQCFRETGDCIGNIFEGNYCKEELEPWYLREIMTIAGVAIVLGINIPLFIVRRRKKR